MLFEKLEAAVKETGIREVAIAGGVAANSLLRAELKKREKEQNWKTYIPKFEYCTDNAAMIGMAAYYKFLAGASGMLLIEQPLWKDNIVSLGIKIHYTKFYYPSWAVYPTWNRFNFIPEVIIGINF